LGPKIQIRYEQRGGNIFFHLSVLILTPDQDRPHRSMVLKGDKEMDRYEAVQENIPSPLFDNVSGKFVLTLNFRAGIAFLNAHSLH